MKKCKDCGGDAHCTTCKNSDGKCMLCEGKGYIWIQPSSGGNSSSGSSGSGNRCTYCNGTGDCKYCDGTGDCEYCDGNGYYVVGHMYFGCYHCWHRGSGAEGYYLDNIKIGDGNCSDCWGTGKCSACDGKGSL
ncbi:MAG: hypothetical protein IJV44_09050 [Prevotella sp.]|nr:hypothetical protein [Prevotella sp.]